MMAHLSARLLGPLYVTLNDELVTGFESDKARALFAYLVVETERPHRREKLAGLLWPKRPEEAARANLRQTLANLRQILGDQGRAAGPDSAPLFLRVSRQTIQLNIDSDTWVDVTTFTDLVKAGALPGDVRHLEQAVKLYRGHFLEGFSVGDSPAFEEWALLKRERLHRTAIEALQRLADAYEQRGEYRRALRYAWRQVELDPWRERARRQLMRLLALSGERGAALAQYETCSRVLDEELGVEPAEETNKLYEQIRNGKLQAPAPSRARVAEPPSFLDAERAVEIEQPVFVARERELAQLEAFLNLGLAGRGRVAFVTGEAGSGKTALMEAFAARAQDADSDLVVTRGDCSANTGVGDPYQPFREILRFLTADVEAEWAAGTIRRAHAQRLWHTLPIAAQALVETGPDLIDTFVPGVPLVKRAALTRSGRAAAHEGAPWLTDLLQLVDRKAVSLAGPGLQQSALFEQYTRTLQALARQRPLVVILDDLQWADAGSINLLFHLGRHVADSEILIVGAYRPEELALGRGGERHPLEPVVNELRRDFGDIIVDLGQASGRDFLEAFLDTKPNRLGPVFRDTLFRQTRGHPLFTTELLRGLQERGDLVRDHAGRWVEGRDLDWETLPARVEAVIAERVGRLDDASRSTLRAASVEGLTFTAEVVARLEETDARQMVARLSQELDKRHRLVRAESILRVNDQRLSRYRFRHILFQKYVYSTVDSVERVRLHEEVGDTLEALYGDHVGDVAVQLAYHFQTAGVVEKAVGYLHQAGAEAARLSANEEAITHLTRGLALLRHLPDTPERARQELALQLAVGAPVQAIKGYAAPEALRAADRARELCQKMGEMPQLLPALFMLANFYHARAQHEKSFAVGEQMLQIAQRTQDPAQVALAHMALGANLLMLGKLGAAQGHLERAIDLSGPHQRRGLSFLVGHDPEVFRLCWSACGLWLLGFPNQALNEGQEALTRAKGLEHTMTLSLAMLVAGCMVHQLRREHTAVKKLAEALMRLSTEHRLPVYHAAGAVFLGWAQSSAGHTEGAISHIDQGLAEARGLGIGMNVTHFLGLLAEASGIAGRTAEGLSAVVEALTLVDATEERYYEAELHRLRGELLLNQGSEAEAESSFHKAVEVARGQGAKSWELLATVSLCRLRQEQGERKEARQQLGEIYGWFTEGFDTPDLVEARRLLEELDRS